MNSFGDKLAKLGDENSTEAGMKKIVDLDNLLNSDIDFGQKGLVPKLDSNVFLNLVGAGEIADILTVKKLITTRKNRSLSSFLSSTEPVSTIPLKQIFNKVEQKIKEPDDNIFHAFQSIVRLSNFKKHNNPIGPGEIAIALSFNDCKLADEQGDIQTGNTNVEVKSQEGCITSRFAGNISLIEHILIAGTPKRWSLLQGKLKSKSPNREEITSTIKKYDTIINAFHADIPTISDRERAILFAYLFGRTFVEYAHKESRFDKILLINSQSNTSIDNINLSIINKPKNVSAKNSYDNYTEGKLFLDSALALNLNIFLASRAGGQFCFKVGFLSRQHK